MGIMSKHVCYQRKLHQGLWAEHWTATDRNNQWDKYNMACMEDRLEECLKQNKILAIDKENQGVIICIDTVVEGGPVRGGLHSCSMTTKSGSQRQPEIYSKRETSADMRPKQGFGAFNG